MTQNVRKVPVRPFGIACFLCGHEMSKETCTELAIANAILQSLQCKPLLEETNTVSAGAYCNVIEER